MPETDTLGLVGQTLDGQLQIESQIGVGDGTCVYRARHLVLEAPVALKFATATPKDGTRPADQVFAEAVRMHYRLERKTLRVARVMSSGTFSPSSIGRPGERIPYLVREWFEGGTLASYLAGRRTRSLGGRPIGGVMTALAPVAEALEQAHADGMAHLGLNPRNVLLTDTDAEGAKVADFGLAAALNGEPREGGRTGWRIPLAAYLSPEQLEGRASEAGAASDVYTLALLVLEMLRDLPVHAADATRAEVLEAGGQAMRRAADPALPREARDILAKALSRDPSARFADATSFWTELSRASMQLPSLPQMPAVQASGMASPRAFPAVDDWDPDAVTAPKVTIPKRRESSPSLPHPPTIPTPPPAATHSASGSPIPTSGSSPSNGPSSSRRLPAAPPPPPHSSPRGMLAAPPLPSGLNFTPPGGVGIASPKPLPAALPIPGSAPPPRVPSVPVTSGPHSPPPPRIETQLQATIVEIPGVATPSFDALAASLKVPDGGAVSFDVTPAPVLPMAPWPPSNNSRNAKTIAPETTVRILRPSLIREVLIAGASFLSVSAIGFGFVFFFGDALHLTHRQNNEVPTSATAPLLTTPLTTPQNQSQTPAPTQQAPRADQARRP